MVSGSSARTARRALLGRGCADRPLPVKVLVLALLLLAVAASFCMRPLDRAAANELAAPSPADVRTVQASDTGAAETIGTPDGDDERRCSKENSTEGQTGPHVSHEAAASSSPVPAALAPPRFPADEAVRDEIGPSPPESRHLLLSILRI